MRLAVVELRAGLLDQVLELALAPVRLVERRVGQVALRHLREVHARGPEVLGERPLEVVVAVERARVHLAELDGDAGALGLLGEDLRGLDDALEDRRGDELDRQALLAGLLEQRLRLLEVLLALRQVGREVLVVRRVEVVRDPALAAQHLVDHLLAVDDQPERLAHAVVVERRGVDAHGERLPRARLGDEDLERRVGLDVGDLRRGQRGDRVDLTAEQRVDPRRVVGEVDDDQLVGVRLAVLPVVRVLQEAALLARREALVLVRTGADRVGRVVVDGHDPVEVLAEVVREARVGELQRHADGAVVQLLQTAAVDVADRGGADLRVLRVGDPLHREDHVVGRDRLAVVEREAFLQADVPRLRRLAGLDRLGQQHLQLGEVRTRGPPATRTGSRPA